MKSFRLPALILSLAVLLASCGPRVPSNPMGLGVGDDAYPFNLPDANGKRFKLEDVHKGWYLMIVLYRGHWCSACLNQLLDLKKDYPKFLELKTAAAAISTDPSDESAEFNASWRFPFPLLWDRRLEVIGAYGAVQPQGHEGKDISKPAVIIVGPDRKIVYKYVGHSPVDIPTDAELLEWLRQHTPAAAR